MRRVVAGFVIACGVAGPAGSSTVQAQETGVMPRGERRITIAGCVTAGEKKDTYVLKNVVVEDPAREGLPAANVFYRLDTTNGFKDQVGRLVQVVGVADFKDLDKGDMKIERNAAGDTVVALKSERQTVKAKVDATDSPGAIAGTSGATTVALPSYSLKVESVKRLANRCP